MKKIFFTLLACFTFAHYSGAGVIFDPATYSGTLKPGMTVVEMNGTKYLQVILDGWNSTIDIPTYTLGADKAVICKFKYSNGPAQTVELGKINAVVQLMDTVNKVPPSWNPNTLVPSTAAISQSPATGAMKSTTAACDPKMKFVHQIQFFGQETVTWGPTTGDTVWVSAISTFDAIVMADPETYSGTLPAGSSIEDIGGKKYFKIALNGWNTVLPIDDYNTMNNNAFTFEYKLDPGTTGKAIADLTSFIQPMVGGSGSFNFSENPASATFKMVETDAKKNVIVNGIQFASQDNKSANWDAVTGAFIYIGKVKMILKEDKPAVAPATLDIPNVGLLDIINADGIVDADEYWNFITTKGNIDRQALPKVSDGKVVDDSNGTFKAAWDNDYLYILVNAEDKIPVEFGAATKAWDNDGVELFIDILDRRFVGQKRLNDQHQLRFNYGRESADAGSITFDNDLATKYEGPTFGILSNTNGWQLELQIPWGNICRTAMDDALIDGFLKENIKDGFKIAMEVSLINCDVLDTRKSIMNWANNTGDDKAYVTNEYYGEVTLKGGDVAVKPLASKNSLKVYPSVISNTVRVELAGMTTVELYDMAGKLVIKQAVHANETVIGTSTLRSGVYVIKANNGAGAYVQKVVKR